MKNSRFNFKKKAEKIKNKIIQDCNGDELEFPDVEANDTPVVGDKILIDNKSNETGERLMPSGQTIVFKDGIVTEIREPVAPKNLIKVTKCSLNRNIQITGLNKDAPYMKGNGIIVDGKELIMARVKVGNILMTVFRGKISKVEIVNPR